MFCVTDTWYIRSASLDARVEVEDLEAWESDHGRIPVGAVLLVHTGRGRHYANRTAYLGYPPLRDGEARDPRDVDNLHFPGFHPAAARWLVAERDVVGVGLDTPSIDYGQSSDFESHQIFGRANVWGLENVANLHMLPPKGERKELARKSKTCFLKKQARKRKLNNSAHFFSAQNLAVKSKCNTRTDLQ